MISIDYNGLCTRTVAKEVADGPSQGLLHSSAFSFHRDPNVLCATWNFQTCVSGAESGRWAAEGKHIVAKVKEEGNT